MELRIRCCFPVFQMKNVGNVWTPTLLFSLLLPPTKYFSALKFWWLSSKERKWKLVLITGYRWCLSFQATSCWLEYWKKQFSLNNVVCFLNFLSSSPNVFECSDLSVEKCCSGLNSTFVCMYCMYAPLLWLLVRTLWNACCESFGLWVCSSIVTTWEFGMNSVASSTALLQPNFT